MNSEDVLLRNRGDIIGFGKLVIDLETRRITKTIHGHELRVFAKDNEDLVSIHSVQVFTEFEDHLYPYVFKSFEDPPVLLGDLNKADKCFKQIVAWDSHKLVENPCPSLTEVGSCPRKVSVEILNSIRDFIPKSPSKIRFARRTLELADASRPTKRQKILKPIYRKICDNGSNSDNKEYLRYLKDADVYSDDEIEPRIALADESHSPFSTGNSSHPGYGLSRSASSATLHEGLVDGELALSDPSYREIKAKISAGKFDESIEQFEEQRAVLKEKAGENDSGGKLLRRQDSPKPIGRASQRSLSTELFRKDAGLSPAERIMKRFSKQQRKKHYKLSGKSNQIQGSASHLHRSDNPARQGNSLGNSLVSPPMDLQSISHSSDSDLRDDTLALTTLVPGSYSFNSQAHFRSVPGDQQKSRMKSFAGNISGSSSHSSALTVVRRNRHISAMRQGSQMMSLKSRQYRFKTRQKASPEKMGQRKAKRMLRVEQSISENPFKTPRPCCNAGCFYLIDPEYTVIQYRRFLKMDRQDRKRSLKSMYVRNAGSFWFSGIYVCSRFLSRGLGFSNQLQCAVKGTPKARASSSILAVPRLTLQETKRSQIILYLRDLAGRIGDSLPTKPHINLPLMSKKLVFEKFVKHNKEHDGKENPSLSYWCYIWKQSCSNIKTHRHHGFTVCDTCERIRAGLEIAENEKMEAALRIEMENHYRFVETERRGYERRRDMSKQHPNKYLSLVIDGADQKSFGLPHFVFPTKEDKGQKLKVKVIGVLEHGIKKQLTLFTLTEEFESGANHIIEALHRTLGHTKARRGKLAPVLFVQADNCTRENKNRFFLSYLEMLVRKGVFQEVHLSFLPIGHTHSDIDQAFSSVATRFRLERAVTHGDMLDLLRNSYNPRAHAEPMDRVANFSGLCAVSRCIRNVNNFSQFRFFRIKRQEEMNGASNTETNEFQVRLEVKIQALDEWTPLDNSSDRRGFLKFTPDLRRTPDTDTTPPDNVLQINKHLRSCEHRIQSVEKLKLLETLRDRVYTRRKEPFHWVLGNCIEENGDYVGGNEIPEDAEMVTSEVFEEEDEEPHCTNLRYSLNFFIAVKPGPDCPDPFWVARTLRVAETKDDGNAKKLLVRWYQAKDSEDVFRSVYTMSTYMRGGTPIVFDDMVDVCSILCEFESLTRRGSLHVRTQKAIRQTLNMH